MRNNIYVHVYYFLGELKKNKKVKKLAESDGNYCSHSDDDTPNATNELTKNARLDEDPALRRMVMEVIFGSSETIANEKSNSNSDQMASHDNKTNGEDQNNLSSSSDSDINSNSSTKTVLLSTKRDNKRKRAARNRTKLEDKDFIYDLDAVLLKEPVEEDLCRIKILEDNEINRNNDINPSKCGHNDLTKAICKDDVVKGKVEKVA